MTDNQSRLRHSQMMSEIRARIDALADSIRSARRQPQQVSAIKLCRCGREFEDHLAKWPHSLKDSGCKAYYQVKAK